MASFTIPEKQKMVSISAPIENIDENINKQISVVEGDVPKPKSNQLLVKMAYASINPSDILYIQGMYGVPLTPPCGAGFEGCGIIVATGGGMFTWNKKVGGKVAFYSIGAWAEYVIIDAKQCITLADTVDLKMCASPIVNPITCLSFIDIVKVAKEKSFVVDAAASALGRMTIRSALHEGLTPICIVRKEEQAKICKEEGAKHVVNTSVDGWENELKEATATVGAKICFDAIGGEISMKILDAMPNNSTLYVYGALAGQPFAQAGIKSLIFQGKTITGYWATQYIKEKSMFTLMGWFSKIGKSLESDLKSTVSEIVPLDNICDAIIKYNNNPTDGKVIIKCTDIE